MDDESADLVLSLQLKDVSAVVEALPERTYLAEEPDGRIALISYRDELVKRLQTLRDARMGRSIACAVNADAIVLAQERERENLAIGDRSVALRVADEEGHQVHGRPGASGPADHLPEPVFDLTEDANGGVMRRLATMNSTAAPVIELIPKPPFRLGQYLRQQRAMNSEESVIGVKKTCMVCEEPVEYFAAVYAPCGHDFCKDCIKQLFFLATNDESLFPPSCCDLAIPMASADVFFTREFVEIFEAKQLEFSFTDRIYCAWKTCGAFIPPTNIKDDTAVCPNCGFHTCAFCKDQSHDNEDCPKDQALLDLLDTARDNGWQRCYRCKSVVELIHGCYHMYCRCGAEFCYICADKWKSCTCPHWHEPRLYRLAQQAANQHVDLPRPPDAPIPDAPELLQIQIAGPLEAAPIEP